MNILKQKLFSNILIDVFKKEVVFITHGGKVDKLYNFTEDRTADKYGELFIVGKNIDGNFKANFVSRYANKLILNGRNNNNDIKAFIDLINKNKQTLRYRENYDVYKYIDHINSNKNDMIIINEEEMLNSPNLFKLKLTLEQNPLMKYDFYDSIKNVDSFCIRNTVINIENLKLLNTFFKNANLEFDNCILDCANSLNFHKNKVIFKNMDINLDYFKNAVCDFEFENCNITSTQFNVIFSDNIKIKDCKIDFTKLALITHFQNVKNLKIEDSGILDINYLSTLFSNTIYFNGTGKIKDFLSMYKFKKLRNFDVGNLYTKYDLKYIEFSADERKDIASRNKHEIEIEKALYNTDMLHDEALYFIEQNRLLRASRLYGELLKTNEKNQLIDLKKEESSLLNYLNKDTDLDKVVLDYDGRDFLYETTLKDIKNRARVGTFEKTDIVNNYFCVIDTRNNIVTHSQKLIYTSNNTPIVFTEKRKKKMTIDSAKEISKKYNLKNTDCPSDKYIVDMITDFITKTNLEADFSISYYLESMRESCDIDIFYNVDIYNKVVKNLKNSYGNRLNKFIKKLEVYYNLMNKLKKEIKINNDNLTLKHEKTINEILQVFDMNFDKLDDSKKTYLFNLVMQYENIGGDFLFYKFFIKSLISKYNIEYNSENMLEDISKICDFNFYEKLNKLHNLQKEFKNNKKDINLKFTQDEVDEINSITTKRNKTKNFDIYSL